jgi:hypothetical protein
LISSNEKIKHFIEIFPEVIPMHIFLTVMLIAVAPIFFWDTSLAQDKAFQETVQQKLNELEKRLDEMDKRYEIRFARIDEKFNRLEDKIAAVNTRIDDKFNLIIGLLGLLATLLALPYVPKLFQSHASNQ